MKMSPGFLPVVLAGIGLLPLSSAALEMALLPVGQSFTGSSSLPGVEEAPAAIAQTSSNLVPDNPTSKLCADGTRAIDQGRWADAVKIFTQVADQHGDHGDGALYWKAYAENKLGQPALAVNSCSALRDGYPKSRWIDDCGALEVEIRSKTGKPVQIEPGESDDVKLLALNAMMRQNEPRALAEIQAILNGDASDRLKKEAQRILSEHYSDATYAQIVRISYIEGDVRIQRGEANGETSGAAWEKATADLPLETGFSVVTGAGRAEIELENASTLYLGENSVLTFNDLHETAGVPYTELGLLSGTVSMHVHPYVAGEKFVLHTPTNDFVTKYPDKSYARVESYTDATAITPLEGGDLRLWGVTKDAIVPGKTWIYRPGQLWVDEGATNDQAFSAWDTWVSDRAAERDKAISSVMEASGLTAPIPGMAEMDGEGRFFDCEPYGTCWEPKDADDGEQDATLMPGGRVPAVRNYGSQRPSLVLASFNPAAQAGATAPAQISEHEVDFPCTPEVLRYRTARDPTTGKVTVTDRTLVPRLRYEWAVCHAGSWIRHRKHYVWVAGGKRHHIDPVRWVRSDRRYGFAPIHPYDVKGQPPINAKHEVYLVSGRNEVAMQPVKLDPDRPIESLTVAPKEYRNAYLRPLAQAKAPRMEAHAFAHAPGGKDTEVSRAAVPIHFDPKSQTFTMAREETRGGKASTVFAPISNHSGTLQARGDSFSGGSGLRGGSSNSGAGGGGSHGSGSSSSSGGGSHGGGGSSGSSSSSSGGSSSGGSGGGPHH